MSLIKNPTTTPLALYSAPFGNRTTIPVFPVYCHCN